MSLSGKIDDLKLKHTHISHNYKDFIEKNALKLAHDLVVPKIVAKMLGADFSRKIWQNTDAIKAVWNGSKVTIYFKSEYFTETGFDVALAREKGTDVSKGGKHWVEPKEKGALHWIQDGKGRFSQGHYVSGMKALKIVETTLDEMTPLLQTELDNLTKKWIQSISFNSY